MRDTRRMWRCLQAVWIKQLFDTAVNMNEQQQGTKNNAEL